MTDKGSDYGESWRRNREAVKIDDYTMACGCESGSCYCDTIDRDWDAYEARRTPALGD